MWVRRIGKLGDRGPIAGEARRDVTALSIAEYLNTLAESGDALNYSGLLQLSDLSSDESDEFEAAWHSISAEVRRDVLGKLTELAEDNLELDFAAAFRSCLADGDDGVRELAARGLWECEDRKVLRPLVDLVSNDPSARVRAAACITPRQVHCPGSGREAELQGRAVDSLGAGGGD